MDRDAALAELPKVYATALRLQQAGADESTIAASLAVDLQAVRPLLLLAAAKLARLLAAADGTP